MAGTGYTTEPSQGFTTGRGAIMDLLDMKLRGEYTDALVFKPFYGKKGDMAPFIIEDQFNRKSGDTIIMGTLNLLTGEGISGDKTLETSEEAMVYYLQQVPINQHRHAVLNEGEMAKQRTPWKTMQDAAKALGIWYANYKEDAIFFTCYYGWPKHIGRSTGTGGLNYNSTNARPAFRWFCADEVNNSISQDYTDTTFITNVQNAEGTLSNVNTDKMQPSILEGIGAKMRAANMQPINHNGFTGFLGVLHTNQVAQLRQHTTWFTAMMNATPRNVTDNPIFKGVTQNHIVGYWNGILLMESNMIHNGVDHEVDASGNIISGNSKGANIRRAIFMGAGAVAIAEANKIHLIHKGDFDYFNKEGVAAAHIFGMARGEYSIDDSSRTATKSQNLIVCSTWSPDVTL